MNFVKSYRNPDVYTLIKKHVPSFHLLYYISHHARRTPDKINNLGIGEVKLGKDIVKDILGLSEMKYRKAKDNLSKFGYCTFRTSNRGTIGKLIDTTIFDPNFQSSNGVTTNQNQDQNIEKKSEEIITNLENDENEENNKTSNLKSETNNEPETDLKRINIESKTPNNNEKNGNNEKNENNKMINESETPQKGETNTSQKKQELKEQENYLIEDFMEWAYDSNNNFGIEKSTEETREFITNTIKKYGYEEIMSIFDDCQSREPWNYHDESDSSAYSQFWNQVKSLKTINRIEETTELIERESKIINHLEKRTKKKFKRNGNLNLTKLLSNKISDNDISRYISWFLDKREFKNNTSVLDNASTNDVFDPELWKEYLKNNSRGNINGTL